MGNVHGVCRVIYVYKFKMTLNIFPHILILISVCQSPILHTVSKAFLKSTKAHNCFLPEDRYNEISECMTKRLTCTEYPFLNPPCTSEIGPMSFDNLLNLEFRLEVNNFPMLEVRQIAR